MTEGYVPLAPVSPMKEPISDELPQFSPLTLSMKEIRDHIPSHLFQRSTSLSLYYAARDIFLASVLWTAACSIDSTFQSSRAQQSLTPLGSEIARWASWSLYWWFQGLVFTGIWVVGHECGHGAFSENRLVCDFVGFVTHSFLWTPFFSWKISHHRHHSNHASMENDEVYVPKARSELGIPSSVHTAADLEEYFGDTPVYTLYMLIRQQVLAFPAYLLFNVSGQKDYPKGTNHFDPSSILFTPAQRNAVLLSNLGLSIMGSLVYYASSRYGFGEVVKYYGIPWLLVTHWFVMVTYLHHTDPVLPHYRKSTWNFQRGAAATMDRDYFGWQGRFFLHDVARFHVIHHFFPKMPFYHTEAATGYLRELLGDQYHYSDKPVFKALWDNYNFCQFVDDEGDILFYRNRKGQTVLKPVEPVGKAE